MDEDGILFNKNKSSLIVCPDGKREVTYEIPDSVTNIESKAFYGATSLTHITLPDGLINIGEEAFADCYNLGNITIPSSVENIGTRCI